MTTIPPGGIGKQTLVELLEHDIRAGVLAPGQRLPSERELAATYRVSRSVVREVLALLAARGHVDAQPGRGSFVREVDPAGSLELLDTVLRTLTPTARQIIEARRMLESETARGAARSATPAALAEIDAALEAFEGATDVVMRARADVDFHTAIARASGNPVYEFLATALSTLTFEIALRSLSDAGVTAEAVPLHREVADAIRAGDGDAASARMVAHLEVALRHYGDDLDARLDLVTQRRIRELLGIGRGD